MSKLIVCFAAASALAFSGSAYAQAIIPPAKPHPAKTAKTTTPPPADDPAASAATPPAADTGDVAQAAPPAAAAPAPAAPVTQTAQAAPAAQPAMPATPATPAQPAPAAQAAQTAPAAPGAAPAAPAPTAVAAGMQLKDNTGAVVGQIAELKPDASGTQMATVKMGADSFTVASSSLVVQNGAAVINLTQAQLQAQVHKPGA